MKHVPARCVAARHERQHRGRVARLVLGCGGHADGAIARGADVVVQVSCWCSAYARGCLHVPAHGEEFDTVTCACCQVQRRMCEVAGVLLLGSDGDFFSFEIEIRTHRGLLRACVQLSRALLERAQLAPWSEQMGHQPRRRERCGR